MRDQHAQRTETPEKVDGRTAVPIAAAGPVAAGRLPIACVLGLQRTAGNRAVVQALGAGSPSARRVLRDRRPFGTAEIIDFDPPVTEAQVKELLDFFSRFPNLHFDSARVAAVRQAKRRDDTDEGFTVTPKPWTFVDLQGLRQALEAAGSLIGVKLGAPGASAIPDPTFGWVVGKVSRTDGENDQGETFMPGKAGTLAGESKPVTLAAISLLQDSHLRYDHEDWTWLEPDLYGAGYDARKLELRVQRFTWVHEFAHTLWDRADPKLKGGDETSYRFKSGVAKPDSGPTKYANAEPDLSKRMEEDFCECFAILTLYGEGKLASRCPDRASWFKTVRSQLPSPPAPPMPKSPGATSSATSGATDTQGALATTNSPTGPGAGQPAAAGAQ